MVALISCAAHIEKRTERCKKIKKKVKETIERIIQKERFGTPRKIFFIMINIKVRKQVTAKLGDIAQNIFQVSVYVKFRGLNSRISIKSIDYFTNK
ncbi:MAG: Fe2+ transport system protein B [Saprospiraceae bacterium]|jgi:Fe2+ transport system protein B